MKELKKEEPYTSSVHIFNRNFSFRFVDLVERRQKRRNDER